MEARIHLADACQMMAQGQTLYACELIHCGLALLAEAPETPTRRELQGQLLTFLQVIEREQLHRGA